MFVQSEGSATMVCLQNMVNYLVREEWYNQIMSHAHGRRVGLGGGSFGTFEPLFGVLCPFDILEKFKYFKLFDKTIT